MSRDACTPPAPANRLVEYDYNAFGQKTRVTLKNSGTPVMDITYNYYANGWLKSVVKDGSTTIAQYQYDKVGNRTRVDLHNSQGAYTTYAYDTVGDPRYLLETIGHYDRTNTELLSIGYTRDSAGNPLSIGSDVYTYDANNRLDSWVNNADYNYDWVGNRVSPGNMVYNAADQLAEWPGQHNYTYLVTGSLFQQQNSNGTEVQKEYIYTYRNLLSTVTHYDEANDPVSSNQWDADDNRVSFTSSTGGTTYFVYDATAGIPAVIEEVLPNSTSAYYVREPNGNLIARVTGTTAANIRYYHFDALGSTRVLTDGNGAKTDEYTYDAWGKLTAHNTYTGTVNQPYMYVGQLGYYSHYQDDHLFDDPISPNSGWQMLQLGVRFYEPGIGRFTQVDPVWNAANPYVYVDAPLSSWLTPQAL